MTALSKKLIEFLTRQCEREFAASNSYFFCSNWFAYHNFPGSASYFSKESSNEYQHGKEFSEYLLKRGYLPLVLPLKVPAHEMDFKEPLDVFSFFSKRENANFESLNELAVVSKDEGDFATLDFLNKFLREQVQSCDEARGLYEKALQYGKIPQLFYHMDHDLRKK